MNIPVEIIALLTGAWGIISGLAGLVYKELKSQIADRDRRIVALEAAAAELGRARDQENAEWRRLAQSAAGHRP
jgi:hypothetical protein